MSGEALGERTPDVSGREVTAKSQDSRRLPSTDRGCMGLDRTAHPAHPAHRRGADRQLWRVLTAPWGEADTVPPRGIGRSFWDTWAVVERWQEPDVAGILSWCRT